MGAVGGGVGRGCCWPWVAGTGGLSGALSGRGCEAGRSPLLTSPLTGLHGSSVKGLRLHCMLDHGVPQGWGLPSPPAAVLGEVSALNAPGRQAGAGRGMMVSRRGLLLFQTCMHPRGWREGSALNSIRAGAWVSGAMGGPRGPGVAWWACSPLDHCWGWERRAQIWLGLGE